MHWRPKMGLVNLNTHLLVSICGYLGGLLLLAGFAATSSGRISAGSGRYHLANLLGGTALLVSCAAQAAWPSVGVNVVWMAVSLLTLAQAAHVRIKSARAPADAPTVTTSTATSEAAARTLQPVA